MLDPLNDPPDIDPYTLDETTNQIDPIPIVVTPEPIHPAPKPAKPTPILGYRKKSSAPTELNTDQLKHFTIPLWIFVVGLSIELLATLIKSRSNPQAAVLHLLIEIAASLPIMMAAILITARFRRISLGPKNTLILRLAAIAIAPSAIGDLAEPLANFIPFGWIPVLIIQFIAYFALLGLLFDLDESDTWYCLCVIFIINVAVMLSIQYFLPTK
jgi:hypothetical protein